MLSARVAVFIDYQNVHLAALQCFWRRGSNLAFGHVDPLKIGHLIVSRRVANGLPSRLVQVRVYRGYPDPGLQPHSSAANDRQADAWARSALVSVTRRPLRYPRRWPDDPATEKGIDVALAVDILRLAAIEEAFDVGVVFSSDTDLLPAIETVIDLRCAHMEVASWRARLGPNRLRVNGKALPWCHWLDEESYRSVADLTDYRKRR
jgi:hypothetical protein